MRYSVAIRTLAKSPQILRRELESLHNQSVLPERIVIYIAEGYDVPEFRVGIEKYVKVRKGMVAQRALSYEEIETDYILLLDDDIELERDAVKALLEEAKRLDADCVACDTFEHHKKPLKEKLRRALVNWEFPVNSRKWAFRIRKDNGFNYCNRPGNSVLPSMSAAGPASLWKKSALLAVKMQDELWLDQFAFAYGDDQIMFYKLYLQGGKLYVKYNSGAVHLDAKTASEAYKKNSKRYYLMGKVSTLVWDRLQRQTTGNRHEQRKRKILYRLRTIWMQTILTSLGIFPAWQGCGAEFGRGVRDAFHDIATAKTSSSATT